MVRNRGLSTRLEVESLVVDRGATRAAVDGVDLAITRSELVFVLGANGSGKSSLLRALAGLEKARTGQVLLDGRPVSKLSYRARAQRIAYLSQGLLAPGSMRVYELVCTARYARHGPFGRLGREDHELVRDALRAVELEDLAQRLVAQLSGGELERALLARAFAQETDFLLLDEPTLALDAKHCLGFLRRLRELVTTGGRAALVASHDLNLAAQFADRILLLERGRPLACGPPAEVLTHSKLAALYGASLVISSRWSGIAGEERPFVLAWDDAAPHSQ